MTPSLPPTTARDRELLDRLSQHEPLSTSELRLLFFTGLRTCRERLARLEAHDFLTGVYPTRAHRGGRTEALWFLSPNGRRMIAAPARRPPGLSIPDLEHRRATAGFFLELVERSLTRCEEGLYRWLGEQQAQQGTGPTVRPDGYGRYLLPDGEIAFYLEIDRGSEPTRRVKTKLDAYRQALAADPHRAPREHPARLRRAPPARQPRAVRATRPAVGMGHHRPRALHAPPRPRPAADIHRAASRTPPRRPPRHRLPRAPLAPPRPHDHHPTAGGMSAPRGPRECAPATRPARRHARPCARERRGGDPPADTPRPARRAARGARRACPESAASGGAVRALRSPR